VFSDKSEIVLPLFSYVDRDDRHAEGKGDGIMSGIEIAIGAVSGTNWLEVAVTALVPAAVGAGAAVLGVWLSNETAERQRQADKAERVEEHQRDQKLAALALADHLETYALSCMDAARTIWTVSWANPYNTDDWSPNPLYPEALPPWPALVNWRDLGADRAVEAENFRRTVELRRSLASGWTEHDDPEDAHVVWSDLAAELGLLAWSLARSLREQYRLAPFAWPTDMDGEVELREHQRRRAEILARTEEARARQTAAMAARQS
jgi:hypothetical protein